MDIGGIKINLGEALGGRKDGKVEDPRDIGARVAQNLYDKVIVSYINYFILETGKYALKLQ